MKPRGPLMIEHRLIEKILDITRKELDSIRKRKEVDPVFIDTVVDFIRTYADRTHHGKEEDILFKELEKKQLVEKDRKAMAELVQEHIDARKVVGELVEANRKYADGDRKQLDTIADKLEFLIGFYPEHIRKEDDLFFPDTERYFSQKELDEMLESFWDFDRKMIHEKYQKLYESLQQRYI